MTQVTLQLPDEMAAQILPMQRWLPTLLALSLAGFRTPASRTVAEVTEFLMQAPTPEQVLAFHISMPHDLIDNQSTKLIDAIRQVLPGSAAAHFAVRSSACSPAIR